MSGFGSLAKAFAKVASKVGRSIGRTAPRGSVRLVEDSARLLPRTRTISSIAKVRPPPSYSASMSNLSSKSVAPAERAILQPARSVPNLSRPPITANAPSTYASRGSKLNGMRTNVPKKIQPVEPLASGSGGSAITSSTTSGGTKAVGDSLTKQTPGIFSKRKYIKKGASNALTAIMVADAVKDFIPRPSAPVADYGGGGGGGDEPTVNIVNNNNFNPNPNPPTVVNDAPIEDPAFVKNNLRTNNNSEYVRSSDGEYSKTPDGRWITIWGYTNIPPI